MSKLKLFTVTFSFLLVTSTLLGNFYLSAVISLILLLGIIIPEYILPIYFLSSLSGFFISAPGLGMGRYLGIVLILSIIIRKLISREQIQLSYIIFLSLILLSSTFSTFFKEAQYTTGFYTMMFNIITILVFSNLFLKKFNTTQILQSVAYSFIVTTLLFSFKIFISLNKFIVGSQRITVLESVNPNELAMVCAQIGIFLFAYSLVVKKNKRFMLFFSLVNLTLVILTGSRTSLLALTLGMFVSYIIYLKVSKVDVIKILKVTVFSLASFLFFNTLISRIPYLSSRMNLESIIDSGGSGRAVTIEKLLNEVIPNNFWFGIGLGTENEVLHLAPFVYNPLPSHNFFISMLTQVGIIGLLMYSFFFIKIIILGLKNLSIDKNLLMPLAMIFTGLFNGIGEIVFIEHWFWNSFALVIFIINNNKKIVVLGKKSKQPNN